MAKFHKLWNDGKVVEARTLQEKMMPLHTSLFLESNPAPVNMQPSLRGIGNSSVRLPLVEVTNQTKDAVTSALETLNLNSLSA